MRVYLFSPFLSINIGNYTNLRLKILKKTVWHISFVVQKCYNQSNKGEFANPIIYQHQNQYTFDPNWVTFSIQVTNCNLL